MARILLTTVGTTGDAEPYRHLAHGLIARGHTVRIVSHGVHAGRFEGLDFVPAAAEFEREELTRVLDEAGTKHEPLAQFEVLVRRLFLRDPEAQLDRYRAVAEGMDLAVCNRFDYFGQEVAIELGIPWIGAALLPDVFPTEEAPPFPFFNLGRWLTRKAWGGVQKAAASLNARVTEVLRTLGTPPRPLGIAGADSPLLNLLAGPASLIPIRGDWPKSIRVTGSWCAPPSEHEPDPNLARFLADHPRPLVVGFGSMGGSDREETNALLSEALSRVQHPVIVQAGWQGLGGNRTEALLTVGFVPHTFLFSKAACVVHHCGAGTTAAVLQAGVPSVPVPHLFDQYYWAGKLHQEGLAPRPAFRKGLTAKVLAARIEEALRSTKMAERASALGEAVRKEDGVARAVEAIESVL